MTDPIIFGVFERGARRGQRARVLRAGAGRRAGPMSAICVEEFPQWLCLCKTAQAGENLMIRRIATFVRQDDGVDMIEYALLVGLLSLACFMALSGIGRNIGQMFDQLGTSLTKVLP
jgi:Flp pilus assembly pilin Flp